MEFELQVITLPTHEGREPRGMPITKGAQPCDYEWFAHPGATAVLMSLGRLGWELSSVLGLGSDGATILLRRRLLTGGKGAH